MLLPQAVHVDRVGSGHHACGIFGTDAERETLVAEFVRGGLDAGERIWCFSNARTPDEELAALAAAGIDVDTAVARGQLAVLPAAGSYLSEWPFSPAAMIAALERAVADARADGFRGFRVTGDMGWAAHDAPGAERLEEYESAVDAIFRAGGAGGLCQYDRRLFSAERLEGLEETHRQCTRPVLLADAGGLRIGALAPRPDTAARLRLVGEADLAGDHALSSALEAAAAAGEGDVHLELGTLRFIDVSGMRRIADAAAALPSSRRIVLHDPPPSLRRMTAVLGDRLDGIEFASAG